MRAAKAKEHLGVLHPMLRATAQEGCDVFEIHRFGFVRCPTSVAFEKPTRLWVDDQALEGFGGTRHRSNMVTSRASRQSVKTLHKPMKCG
jgi:hypothetical protein